jgi:K+-sensing histidine kinase KdpD
MRMHPPQELSTEYRLRTVRIGIVATALVLVALVVYPILPHPISLSALPYAMVIVAAAAGGLLVGVLPWRTLFDMGIGIRFLYAWSIGDITLISLGVAISGSGRSDLFVMYGLTTVFFGASYPIRGQMALLAFTLFSYVTVLAATGWHITAGALFLRLASLSILAMLAGFLANELIRQMGAENEARGRAERWASRLSSVAHAARRMTLDPDRVVEGVLDAMTGMGFARACLCGLDQDGRTYRVEQAQDLPEEDIAVVASIAVAMTALVLRSGTTLVLDGDQDQTEAHSLIHAAGFGSLIACPIWTDGWMAAVLIGCRVDGGGLPLQEQEALELLGAQTGMALENAQRFQEERRTVERLEELDHMKNDFLATVSHELRTPVTVIEGVGLTLEGTWDTLDEASKRDLLRRLNANAEALDGLIANLLDFSRLERSQAEDGFEAIQLSILLMRIVDRLAPLFADHLLRAEIEPDLIALGDAVLLERVVENLLSNAAKHTPDGTSVVLSARAGEDEVEVEVLDRGPGIPAEELDHLGERFYRGGDLNTRKRGLGLGLALAREILELHSSNLEVRSSPGEGSRFSFRLRSVLPASDALPALRVS